MPPRPKDEVYLSLARGDFLALRVTINLLVKDSLVMASHLERRAPRFERSAAIRAKALDQVGLGNGGEGTAHGVLVERGYMTRMALPTSIIAHILDFRADVEEGCVVRSPRIVVRGAGGRRRVTWPPSPGDADREAHEGRQGAY